MRNAQQQRETHETRDAAPPKHVCLHLIPSTLVSDYQNDTYCRNVHSGTFNSDGYDPQLRKTLREEIPASTKNLIYKNKGSYFRAGTTIK